MYFMADYYAIIHAELVDFGDEHWLELFTTACGSEKQDDRGYRYYEVSSDGWNAFMDYSAGLAPDFSDFANSIKFAVFTPYLSTHDVGGL